MATAVTVRGPYPAGMDLIAEGLCPLGKPHILNCFVCPQGHATECHFPATCEELRCVEHAQLQMARVNELGGGAPCLE